MNEREISISYLLVYFSNSQNSCGWAKLKPGARASVWDLQVPGPACMTKLDLKQDS